MAQVYKTTSFFVTRMPFRRFWFKEPRHSKNILADTCYLYRSTRPYEVPCAVPGRAPTADRLTRRTK